jgi:hypothetical protein
MLRFSFHKEHFDKGWRVDFSEMRANVGYRLDATVIVQGRPVVTVAAQVERRGR